MGERTGAAISVTACLFYLVVLIWPYAVRSPTDVTIYYTWGVLNVLFPGALAVAILAAFAASRSGLLSSELAAGIALGGASIAFLGTAAWAVTARVDVFRASGWALPAQRYVLVGLSSLIVVGAARYAWPNGIRSALG